MTIKALCFDADGVVVNPQMQFARYLEEKHVILPEMTRNFFLGVFSNCLTGSTDLKQVLPSFFQNWGWKGSVEEFVNTWLFTDHVIDMRIINSIRRLRNDGMICCLTTSQENYRAEYMKNKMGFQDIFDHLFFSCEIGWQKPNHKFFHHVEKILNLKGGEILFWDDSYQNIDAARDCDWNAELYTDFDEFNKVTKEYTGYSIYIE